MKTCQECAVGFYAFETEPDGLCKFSSVSAAMSAARKSTARGMIEIFSHTGKTVVVVESKTLERYGKDQPMTENNPTVGATIRERRQAAGITQLALAIKLGATPGMITNWERDVNHPAAKYVRRLAQELGGQVGDYLAQEDEK